MADRTKALIVILVLIIVVLVGTMAFTFLIKPKVTGYTTNLRNEGVVIAVNSILAQLQQQQFVSIPIDAQGHYIILAPTQDQPGLPQQEAPAQ